MQDRAECILIVNESELDAQILSEAVSVLAPVMVAKSGNEALNMVAERDFDVVLLDIMLPDIDGFEVCRQIIESKKPNAPAVIFVASKDDIANEEKGLSLGAVDYIYRPTVPSVVQARVGNHLQLNRARRELSSLNIELDRMGTTDPLTGVLNRRQYYALEKKELARAKRYDQGPAVIALDLDHFKSINDTYGRDQGDAVLKAVAAAWTKTLRTSDILGRIGGEEFSIFLPQTDREQAEIAANRLLEATRKLNISASPFPPRSVANR